MAYMNKETMLKEAERLGILDDIKDMSWNDANHYVRAAIKADAQAQAPEVKQAEVPQPELSPEEKARMLKGRIIIAPEIRQTQYQLLKYDEELGDEVEVEEKYYDINNMTQVKASKGYETSTYNIKSTRGGRKVVAQSTIPKENAAMYIDHSLPIAVPVVEFNGRRGYLWKHWMLPNVKQLLMESGNYEKYADVFDSKKHPENLWYATGIMAASIPAVHSVMRQIEIEAAKLKELGL